MQTAQRGFVWYELLTSDLAAATTFYTQVIDWRTEEFPGAGMPYTVLRNASPAGVGGMMELTRAMCDSGLEPGWFGYVKVPDVDTAVAHCVKLGGSVHHAPDDIPSVGRFAVIADPQGAVIQLLTPAQPGERRYSRAPGDTGWHELHTSDWSKAFEFYSQMFGWAKGDSLDMGPMGTYQLFTLHDEAIGGMMTSPLAAQAGFWLYYFNVADLEQSIASIKQGGGAVMHGPTPVPNGGTIIQAKDPQGAWFALFQPPA